ncbi:MAG: C39 family peptidase [Candidatus Peribacteraceae bacterium]|nr:C39 family peptidase [Candidatus Peribacteraceae bacterium]
MMRVPTTDVFASTGILTALLFCACSPQPPPPEIMVLPRETEAELPRKVNLDVPFSTQAPFADWEDPRQQEGCEEMSLLMVHHYLEGTDLEPQQALDELMALSDWEKQHGYTLDVTLTELARIAEEYYGHETTVIEDVSVDTIKRLLASGHPVIVPAAGRKLGNPYFSGEGPWYHMLVLTGYDGKRFITNDPGTRRGKGYEYTYDVLLGAIHDWTGVKEEISTGQKRLLILDKTGQL